MIKAVIFDLDGTIGNTLKLCILAFRKAVEPLAGRIYSEEEIKSSFGPSEEGTVMKIIPERYEEAIEAYIKNYSGMHGICAEPFDGIREIIGTLKNKGLKIGLVTGKGRRSYDITLDRYGMTDMFDAVEVGSPHGPCKPKGIKTVLEKFGVSPEEAVSMGDAPSDITASREAGVKIISVAWAETSNPAELEELGPDQLFTDVEKFGKYITELTE
ncbi:MAG: HAD hydrolase-like protein [Rikenellaceae bacterium]|nr:HAD hydrolase-like protein [Rikenellaceae bacterium]